MANFTVVYDSNVLYPAPLRDLPMRLALTDLFRARWTDEIHEEWMRNLSWPISIYSSLFFLARGF